MTEADFEQAICNVWKVASNLEKDIYEIKNDRNVFQDLNKALQDSENIKNKLLDLKIKLQQKK